MSNIKIHKLVIKLLARNIQFKGLNRTLYSEKMEQQQHRKSDTIHVTGDAFQSTRPCTVMEPGPAQEGPEEKSSAGSVDFTKQVIG